MMAKLLGDVFIDNVLVFCGENAKNAINFRGNYTLPPLSIGSISIPHFIYKTKQCIPLCIENMQITPSFNCLLNSSKINEMFYVFSQFQVIILKISHYILIYQKNILFFLLGFNIKLDSGGDLHIFNT